MSLLAIFPLLSNRPLSPSNLTMLLKEAFPIPTIIIERGREQLLTIRSTVFYMSWIQPSVRIKRIWQVRPPSLWDCFAMLMNFQRMGPKQVGPDKSTCFRALAQRFMSPSSPKAQTSLQLPLRGKQWSTEFLRMSGNLGLAPKPKAGIILSQSQFNRMFPTAMMAFWYWLGWQGSIQWRELWADGTPLDPVKSIATERFSCSPPLRQSMKVGFSQQVSFSSIILPGFLCLGFDRGISMGNLAFMRPGRVRQTSPMNWCLASPSSSQSQHQTLNFCSWLSSLMSLAILTSRSFQLGLRLSMMTSVRVASTKVLSFLIFKNLRQGSLLSQKSNQLSVFISL